MIKNLKVEKVLSEEEVSLNKQTEWSNNIEFYRDCLGEYRDSAGSKNISYMIAGTALFIDVAAAPIFVNSLKLMESNPFETVAILGLANLALLGPSLNKIINHKLARKKWTEEELLSLIKLNKRKLKQEEYSYKKLVKKDIKP